MTKTKETILTATEEEILYLLTVERLTPKQAANRRKCSPQAVYATKKRLEEKGVLRPEYKTNSPQETKGGLPDNSPEQVITNFTWDLHGCKWRIKILEGSFGDRYRSFLGKGVGVFRPRAGVSVECFDNILLVHSDKHWFGSSPESVVQDSWDWLFRILAVLENDLGLLLIKPRASNVRRYAGHFARPGDAGAVVVPGGDSVVVQAFDGKRRFVIDWSKGVVPEAEFVHSRLGQSDAVFYEGYVRDLLESRLTLSELLSLHADLVSRHKDLVEVVSSQALLLSSLLPKGSGVQDGADRSFPDYVG